MPLDHRDDYRFTPEQRDEILRLAGQLQVQHEETVGTDELVRAAEEAGIDPQFVQEAALRLGQKPQSPSPAPRLGAGIFILQTLLFVSVQVLWWNGLRTVTSPASLFPVAMAFLLAIWIGRQRRIRWVAPAAIFGASLILALGIKILAIFVDSPASWLPLTIEIALLQTVAALAGTLVATVLDPRFTEHTALHPRRG